MERPYKEVELPISKKKVGIYDYYLRGDTVAIDRIMSESAEFDKDGNVVRVKAGFRLDMDNEAVLRIIKYIKDGDINIEVTLEAVNTFPEDDFQFLMEHLPERRKKKLTQKPLGDTSKPRQKKEE
jgi:hypothetical protein